MAKRQFFGIKYPFTKDSDDNYFVDVNKDMKGRVRSQLMHVLFTPKGQYVRNPEFGTDLIKYIFEPNDSTTWDNVKQEVRDSVQRWLSNITINNISVIKNQNDESEIYVRIDYTVQEGNISTTDSIATKI